MMTSNRYDLRAEVALWQRVWRVPEWTIHAEQREGLTHPVTGAPCLGLCEREPESRTATLLIDPGQPWPEWVDTICHEVGHCAMALLQATRELEENVVWTVSRAMAWVRCNAPDLLERYVETLPWGEPAQLARIAKATTTPEGFAKLAARLRPPGGGSMSKQLGAAQRAMIDHKKLLEIGVKAGQLIEKGELPPEAMTLLQEVASMANEEEGPPDSDAGPPSSVPPSKPMAEAKPEGGDKMPGSTPEDENMGKDEGPMYKRLAAKLQETQQRADEDRAAAVDGLLDTRADLTKAQRAHAREIGIRDGVAKLRTKLPELFPPPVKPMDARLGKLGVDKPIGAGGPAKHLARPSGNKASMARLRVFAKADAGIDAPGITVCDEEMARDTGKSVIMSIADAYAEIREATEQAIARKRVNGGAA
jgi:hypothetical protein